MNTDQKTAGAGIGSFGSLPITNINYTARETPTVSYLTTDCAPQDTRAVSALEKIKSRVSYFKVVLAQACYCLRKVKCPKKTYLINY